MAGTDELDAAIIGEFQSDGRVSHREVARRLGVSEGTIRGRVRRLEAERLLRFVAVTDPTHLSVRCSAYVCLQVEHGAESRVARALCELPEFSFMAVTLGRFNVIGLVNVESRDRLAELLTQQILPLPGVRRTETLEALDVFKHDHRWVRLTA